MELLLRNLTVMDVFQAGFPVDGSKVRQGWQFLNESLRLCWLGSNPGWRTMAGLCSAYRRSVNHEIRLNGGILGTSRARAMQRSGLRAGIVRRLNPCES